MRISVANAAERQVVYRMRHDVYSTELGQYASRPDGALPDTTDITTVYIVASVGGDVVGFVGITPPSSPRFSVEKHLARDEIPIALDEHTFEIRALTVTQSLRGSYVVAGLMYAAFRWVEAHGGKRVVSIGRREVLGMYLRLGLKRAGRSFACGAVTYELISAELADIASRLQRVRSRVDRMEERLDWKLDVTFHSPSECYHGGAFFDAIGDQFDDMSRARTVINADVLDAWFPPAQEAQDALRCRLPWIMRTSPPTRADGLAKTIAEARGVDPHSILTGGGSSALIFLAFRYWLNRSSRVLLLDPTYGEYAHVLDRVVQCETERLLLDRSNGYRLDPTSLANKLAEGFDLFVWVNPNSPTGLHVARADVEAALGDSSACKRVWIDETYIEYAGREQSLETFAVQSENIIVCKSMSKVYALSGLRVAYLCASPHQLEPLRVLTPPWSVGLPAQIAATHALRSEDYYRMRYQQTHELRKELVSGLRHLGISEIVPGIANFVMFHPPAGSNTAACIVRKCRAQGLFLRNVATTGGQAIRMAVKDAETNQRMLTILADVFDHPVGDE
ncbi:aminotransferase class I/II-fold pyridoxal phosphate-dependent enzyme [Verrucomicrobiota bacterium]